MAVMSAVLKFGLARSVHGWTPLIGIGSPAVGRQVCIAAATAGAPTPLSLR